MSRHGAQRRSLELAPCYSSGCFLFFAATTVALFLLQQIFDLQFACDRGVAIPTMSNHEFAYFPFAGGRGEAIRCASLRGVAQCVTQRDVAATCCARRKWGGAAGRWRRRSGARWACRHAGAPGRWRPPTTTCQTSFIA